MCKTLQRPPTGFFQLFGLEEKLAIDAADLQKRFYDLSRKMHPDLFTLKTPEEQECALEGTSILNDGFRTLKDPIARAEYVLKNHGFDIGEQRSNNVPPELLEEVFELNEALEEIRGGDASVRPHLVDADQKFRQMMREADQELDVAFRSYDDSHDNAVLQKVRGILNRRKYIQNLVSEVEKELAVA